MHHLTEEYHDDLSFYSSFASNRLCVILNVTTTQKTSSYLAVDSAYMTGNEVYSTAQILVHKMSTPSLLLQIC